MHLVGIALFALLQITSAWNYLPSTWQARVVGVATNTNPNLAAATPTNTQGVAPDPLTGLSIPVPSSAGTPPPRLGAVSALAIDKDTGMVLYTENAGAKRPIASITKLVTAMVVLSSHKPDEVVTIPQLPEYPSDAELAGLVAGDRTTIANLVEALLVPSANDAADALAIIDAGSIPKFAAKMNAKMTKWGIADTRFNNPSGLRDDGNYTTATALGRIAQLALTEPTIRTTVRYTDVIFSTEQGRTYTLSSTNKLLATGRFYGIKTGYTQGAGECFVGLSRINGHEVITVVLGANDRFGATTTLTNWVTQNWQWL